MPVYLQQSADTPYLGLDAGILYGEADWQEYSTLNKPKVPSTTKH